MRKTTRIISLVLITLIGSSLIAIAAPTEKELQNLQEQLEQQIEQTERELSQKKNQESKALQELRNINNVLNKTEKNLRYTESNLNKTIAELEKLEEELKKTEENLELNMQALSSRLNTIYEQGNIHILEVLLSSTSFTDFLTRWDLMSRLAEMDVELIADVKEQLKAIEEQKNEVLVKKETLIKLRDDQSNQKAELAVASSRQKEIYSNLAAEKKALEAALIDLENESRKIEEELMRLNPNTQYLGSGNYSWPTPGNKRITSSYGYRTHPITRTRSFHTGVDIAAPYGSNIVAVDHGLVVQVAWRGAYGRVVMVDHGRGIVTMYAHTSAALVKEGQSVMRGDPIAKIGTTGWSTGPHLHFEVRVNGKHVQPLDYIKK